MILAHERVYLSYLAQARLPRGLPPDGREWDHPCPQFRLAAEQLERHGLARRRWLFFGPYGITRRGVEFLLDTVTAWPCALGSLGREVL